jgi:hypothetical protein
VFDPANSYDEFLDRNPAMKEASEGATLECEGYRGGSRGP